MVRQNALRHITPAFTLTCLCTGGSKGLTPILTSNMRVAQEALDHKNISTTQIYTHIVAEQKKKAVAALPY